MPLRVPQEEESGMNLTPMIDVVMLLNIFFMVGSRLVEPEKQYDINLPTVAEARPLTALPDEIILNVKSDGIIFVKGKQRELPELEADLKQAAKRYPDQTRRVLAAYEKARTDQEFLDRLDNLQGEVDEVVDLVCAQMQSAYELRVPLKVDLEKGANWEEMEEVST